MLWISASTNSGFLVLCIHGHKGVTLKGHYSLHVCGKTDLYLRRRLVAATTNGFIFQIIASLTRSGGYARLVLTGIEDGILSNKHSTDQFILLAATEGFPINDFTLFERVIFGRAQIGKGNRIYMGGKWGEDKTWTRGPWTPSLDRGHGPLLWTGSMDPLSWTRSMDSFLIFIRRFCTRSMDAQKQK